LVIDPVLPAPCQFHATVASNKPETQPKKVAAKGKGVAHRAGVKSISPKYYSAMGVIAIV